MVDGKSASLMKPLKKKLTGVGSGAWGAHWRGQLQPIYLHGNSFSAPVKFAISVISTAAPLVDRNTAENCNFMHFSSLSCRYFSFCFDKRNYKCLKLKRYFVLYIQSIQTSLDLIKTLKLVRIHQRLFNNFDNSGYFWP